MRAPAPYTTSQHPPPERSRVISHRLFTTEVHDWIQHRVERQSHPQCELYDMVMKRGPVRVYPSHNNGIISNLCTDVDGVEAAEQHRQYENRYCGMPGVVRTALASSTAH